MPSKTRPQSKERDRVATVRVHRAQLNVRDLRGNQPQAMVPLALEMGKKARSLSLYTLGLIFITDL